jgi:uncharacterized protein involved in tolerance to divalent cations
MMIYRSDMYIKDEELRKNLQLLLMSKTRNQIVKEIKADGVKMHQYNIDRFLANKSVSLDTVKKLDKYVENQLRIIQ